MTEYDERSKRREKNRKIWVLYRPKIAMDVHDLKHRKLRKRKQRGRKLRGYGVSDFTPTPLKTQSICSFDTP